jgi:hypothetical protein
MTGSLDAMYAARTKFLEAERAWLDTHPAYEIAQQELNASISAIRSVHDIATGHVGVVRLKDYRR